MVLSTFNRVIFVNNFNLTFSFVILMCLILLYFSPFFLVLVFVSCRNKIGHKPSSFQREKLHFEGVLNSIALKFMSFNLCLVKSMLDGDV